MTSLNANPNPIAARHDRRRPPGFSLIELVMVLAIISVLAAIAVPRYSGALARYRADAAAQRVVTDLEYAQKYAKAQSATVQVHFKPTQDLMDFDSIPSLDDPAQLWELNLAEAPYHADLVSTNFPSDKLCFDGYGVPDSSGNVVIAVGTETRTVTLDAATGKAVIQ